MSGGNRVFEWVALALVGVVLAGCAPVVAPSQTGGGTANSSPRVATKVLRLGMIKAGEPDAGVVLGGSGLRGLEHAWIFHAGLTAYDPQSNLLPRVAAKVPSLEDGDWKALPDGRMEVTWKLRPDVTWHDGAPATAADFVLGLAVLQDPELPFGSEIGRQIASASAPDPQTLIVTWRTLYPLANASGPEALPAVPVHILGELYRAGDRQAMLNSAYWAREFVGLGPYRLGPWSPGSHLEALAYDGYFLGRPKIDRLVLKYVGDANVLYVNVIAGEVDAIPFGSFQADHFSLLKQNWAAAGAGTALVVLYGTRNYRFQFRDSDAPWVKDRRVRRALIHMLDRPALVDALLDGASTPADTLASPNDPVYRLVEQRGLTRYPYDLAQAQRLMAEAGWLRATDGTFRAGTGPAFGMQLKAQDFVANVKEVEAVAGQLKAAGVEATTSVYSSTGSAAESGEARAVTRGLIGMPLREPLSFSSPEIPTEINRWRGTNYGGYSNPTYDRLYEQSLITLDTNQRLGLIADMLKIEADEATSMHLYYALAQQTLFFRTGVRGPGVVSTSQLATAWNIHLWDLD